MDQHVPGLSLYKRTDVGSDGEIVIDAPSAPPCPGCASERNSRGNGQGEGRSRAFGARMCRFSKDYQLVRAARQRERHLHRWVLCVSRRVHSHEARRPADKPGRRLHPAGRVVHTGASNSCAKSSSCAKSRNRAGPDQECCAAAKLKTGQPADAPWPCRPTAPKSAN